MMSIEAPLLDVTNPVVHDPGIARTSTPSSVSDPVMELLLRIEAALRIIVLEYGDVKTSFVLSLDRSPPLHTRLTCTVC